jgi:hypothetical protein
MSQIGHNHSAYIESLEAEAAELVAEIREKASRLEEIKTSLRAERRVVLDGVYTYDADGMDIQRELMVSIRNAGSGKAFAEALGLSPTFVSDVATARRPVSDRVANALGFEKVVGYRRIA